MKLSEWCVLVFVARRGEEWSGVVDGEHLERKKIVNEREREPKKRVSIDKVGDDFFFFLLLVAKQIGSFF